MEDEEHILDSGEIYKDPNEEKPSFPPLEFLNPKVDWSRVKRGTRTVPGGNKLKTHVLVPFGNGVIRFIPTLQFTIWNLFLPFLGAFTFIISILGLYFKGFLVVSFLVFLIGVFVALNKFAFKRLTFEVFDKNNGVYKKGFFKKTAINLSDIKAIQLIQEYVRDDQNDSFNSYEINVVLKSGDRINVVDHGAERAAHRQAKRLAEFLNVPLLMLKDDDYKRYNIK